MSSKLIRTLIILISSLTIFTTAWCKHPLPLKTQRITLAKGLILHRYLAYNPLMKSDQPVVILQINPREWQFELINSSAQKTQLSQTAKQWAIQYKLTAAINAGMYQNDHITSTGFMKNKRHINNERMNRDKIMFAFNPLKPNAKTVFMFDQQCDSFFKVKQDYRTIIQNIRMLSCKEVNVWSLQNKLWSTAAIGINNKGHILFIHTRAPYRVHNFITLLKKLPIYIKRAMYVEGGPEAQLYINAAGHKHEFVGSYETGFNENHNNKHAWKIPNIIGIRPRASTKTKP